MRKPLYPHIPSSKREPLYPHVTKSPSVIAKKGNPIPESREYQITDSRGISHTFTVRWHERLAMTFYFLDDKRVNVDDQDGWIYAPEGRQVKDKVLRDKMDKIVFREGVLTEEQRKELLERGIVV